MKDIETIGLIGLGALGMLFSNCFVKSGKRFVVIADAERAERIRRDGAIINGEHVCFEVRTPEEGTPLDLVIFATKAGGLSSAMETAAPFVGETTCILSVLNGISSEEELERRFGKEEVLLCTAQGMDAVREGNRLSYAHPGTLVIGERAPGKVSERAGALAEFLTAAGIPTEAVPDMVRRQWGKLMLNVGINQTVMVYEGTYRTVQQPGEARETMLSAMREVLTLANLEGFALTEHDLNQWVALADTLAPEGMPSMRQDAMAHRKSEVELFAGTVIRLAKTHGLDVPVNEMLYRRIREMESMY